jgi:hypothetical protein
MLHSSVLLHSTVLHVVHKRSSSAEERRVSTKDKFEIASVLEYVTKVHVHCHGVVMHEM